MEMRDSRGKERAFFKWRSIKGGGRASRSFENTDWEGRDWEEKGVYSPLGKSQKPPGRQGKTRNSGTKK